MVRFVSVSKRAVGGTADISWKVLGQDVDANVSLTMERRRWSGKARADHKKSVSVDRTFSLGVILCREPVRIQFNSFLTFESPSGSGEFSHLRNENIHPLLLLFLPGSTEHVLGHSSSLDILTEVSIEVSTPHRSSRCRSSSCVMMLREGDLVCRFAFKIFWPAVFRARQ